MPFLVSTQVRQMLLIQGPHFEHNGRIGSSSALLPEVRPEVVWYSA